MNPKKWRISKACHECRARKIRCNGELPCQRCTIRGIDCVYREKARDRARKNRPTDDVETPQATASIGASEDGFTPGGVMAGSQPGSLPGQTPGHERSIQIHSVAATHRASPSCLLQLYYGPSSNFSLLYSIYHQIAGTRPSSPSREGVEEVGPGLDLFSHRRLFFGDLADAQRPLTLSEDYSAMVIDPETARRLLERYLSTYWYGIPVLSKDIYRRRLDDLFRPPAIVVFDSPDTIILMIAMAIGAFMTGEEPIAEFFYQKAKQGMAKLDEVVNLQVVQIHLMMGIFQSERARPNSSFLSIGCAVRKAVAAGLHKGAPTQESQTEEDMQQRRITFWSLYFWETWNCFTLGRPTSIPDPDPSLPLPSDQKFLVALVTLSRIMSKCVNRIYAPQHDSLLPVWNAANEIRRDLYQFAEQQLKDVKLGIVGDINSGELGVCQVMVSTMYHHTLLLAFRPFLILRAKIRQENSASGSSSLTPPAWLNSACEYCLDAARTTIGFLSGACEQNSLCRELKYHGFFIEGACYVIALDMMQERSTGHSNLSWIRTGLRCLRSLVPKTSSPPGGPSSLQIPTTIAAIERMVRAVIPDFELGTPVNSDAGRQHAQSSLSPTKATLGTNAEAPRIPQAPSIRCPTMPFGFDINGQVNEPSPSVMAPDEQMDFTAADIGWAIDFGSMDMEAFLSLDPSQTFDNFAA